MNSKTPDRLNKRTHRIRIVVFTALMTALTAVLTLASIPYPTGAGYYNFGDVPIFMSACLLGPIPALVTGALGAMLGDVILGYTLYAPFTLVIKALEGVISALLFKACKTIAKKQVAQAIFYCLGNIVGGVVMAVGYFLAEGILLADDSWAGGILNLPFNILQGLISAIFSTVLLYAFRIKLLFEKIYNRNLVVNSKREIDSATPDTSQNNDSESQNNINR